MPIYTIYRKSRYLKFIENSDMVYLSILPIIAMQTLTMPTQLQQAIIARRKKLKLSQSKVASRLGISQNRYSELESSIELISLDRLLVLMSVLEMELQFGLKGDLTSSINASALVW